MGDITFIQYLMPDGKTIPNIITRPDEISNKAEKIVNAGFRLEIEMLSDYNTISMTIFDLFLEEDVAIEVVENGPAVPVAVDKLISEFEIKEKAA